VRYPAVKELIDSIPVRDYRNFRALATLMAAGGDLVEITLKGSRISGTQLRRYLAEDFTGLRVHVLNGR